MKPKIAVITQKRFLEILLAHNGSMTDQEMYQAFAKDGVVTATIRMQIRSAALALRRRLLIRLKGKDQPKVTVDNRIYLTDRGREYTESKKATLPGPTTPPSQ